MARQLLNCQLGRSGALLPAAVSLVTPARLVPRRRQLYNLVVALSWILFGGPVGLIAQGITYGKAFEKG